MKTGRGASMEKRKMGMSRLSIAPASSYSLLSVSGIRHPTFHIPHSTFHIPHSTFHACHIPTTHYPRPQTRHHTLLAHCTSNIAHAYVHTRPTVNPLLNRYQLHALKKKATNKKREEKRKKPGERGERERDSRARRQPCGREGAGGASQEPDT
eukprot:1884981-Rhodomonas_salina.1